MTHPDLTQPGPVPPAYYPCGEPPCSHWGAPQYLFWSARADAWICNGCWWEQTHGERGVCLADHIAGSGGQ